MEPIAAAYHWPPDVILAMDFDEIARWHELSEARLKVTAQATAAYMSATIARMFGAK